MPPRHVYWTIIYGNQATSFRAATPEELLPTLKQLQSRHPDAVLKYFARGKLWESPEAARRPRDDRRPASPNREGEARGKAWRPGGTHRDPHDRWKVPRDVKRKRLAHRHGWGRPRDNEEKPAFNARGDGRGGYRRKPDWTGNGERPARPRDALNRRKDLGDDPQRAAPKRPRRPPKK